MTEPRWAQVKALFEAAVERPASERAGFLRAAAGGDQLLRREVESLLRADDPNAALTNLLQQHDGGPRSESIDTNDVSSDDTRTHTASTVRTTIGPYRLVGLLGAGGMGEVFRARDAKLNRDVALKLLPGAFAFDPDRLARFRREARALAALNHPHIGAIYGLEESEGRQALVLELVEGVTLAERIAGGPLPVREALTLARQIAGALEAAHDKGIVHRDLKPANIKVTAAGIVKVLDFGLAKTAAVERMAGEVVNESLTADGRTRVGAVVGTAAYMSPEQARGLEVDTRTDIWAFGCVLFEMLSGRKAFGADAGSDSKEKVLAREPDWTVLPARTPVKVLALLRRCLEKDPDRRLRTIADAQQLIDRLLNGGSLMRRVAAAAVAAAALAAMLAYGLVGSGSPAETSSPLFSQLTDAPGVETSPSLSPDDVSLVYASPAGTMNWEIYSQRIGGTMRHNLTNSPGYDGQPAFSHDGAWIAFRSTRGERGGLFVMGASGEDVKRLSDQGFNPTWSPTDKEIAVSTDDVQDPGNLQSAEGRLVVVEVATGRTREIGNAVDVHQPHWSPNGFRIAYWARPGGTGPRDLWTVAANGVGAPVPVTNDAHFDWNPVWSPDGRWLYFSSNRGGSMDLWRVRIDESSGTVQGQPEPVATPSPYSGFMSISRSGHRIAYVKTTFDENLFKIAFDPSRDAAAGQPTAITRGTRRTFLPDLSPDGEWVVAVTHESDGQEDLVLVRTGGNDSPSKLTNGPDRDLDPKWSPDGKTIAFQSNRSGTFQIWMINADGSGLGQFTNADVPMLGPLWSPIEGDHRMVVESPGGPHGPARALVLDTQKPWSKQTPEPLPLPLPPGATFSATSWSADGRQLALNMPGGAFIYDFETRRGRNVSKRRNPRWLSDSRRLFVGGGSPGLDLINPLAGKSRPDVLTFPFQLNGYALSRDDRLVVYGLRNDQADIWLATVEDRATGPR